MNALRRLLEIAVSTPCERGAPQVQRLVDGELGGPKSRAARRHVESCERCRSHLRFLELEEQAVREIAAPTPRRFVALWSERLDERMAEAVAEEAGEKLLRLATDGARGERVDGAPLERYLAQLAQWRGEAATRSDSDRPLDFERCLAEFERLLGPEWPPAVAARRLLTRPTSRPRPL